MTPRIGTIYALVDPGDGRPRYVGSTVMYYPKQRLGIHRIDARLGKPRPVNTWLRTLGGRDPELVTLEKCPEHDLATREQVWIDALRAVGCDLLNRHRAARVQRRRPVWEAARARLANRLLTDRQQTT